MSLLRFIARMDIKGPNVVKGIQFEGLRVIGEPVSLAQKYCEVADEILYIDTVATLYGRNQLKDLLYQTSEKVFIPITVGGGIRSMDQIQELFNAGADKVCINTGAIRHPDLIDMAARRYGSQAIVISIEAKRTHKGWEAYTDNGREKTGKEVIAWAEEVVNRGCGEVLITSVDREGTKRGIDCELISNIDLPVPVVACGGIGSVKHVQEAIKAGADAVAMASALHYDLIDWKELRDVERQIQNANHPRREERV